MKYIITILLLALAPSPALAHTITGTVVKVTDGDTITVRALPSSVPPNLRGSALIRVRLAEIDAPEKNQAYGPEASQALSDMVLDQVVVVEWTKKDRYRRIIGTIYATPSRSPRLPLACHLRSDVAKRRGPSCKGGGSSVNHLLVARGYAWQYTKYSKCPLLKHAQSLARDERLGLWGGGEAVAPWLFRKR